MTERTLILLRHAKSDWPTGVSDRDRPLADRGRRDAPVAGAVLATLAEAIDTVVVSSANRTQQTWALIRDHVDARSVVTEPAIYEASARGLLDVVRALPDTTGTALLVGHNPGMADLTLLLAGHGDADARERIEQKFPTCGMAILHFSGAWSDVSAGAATLVGFHVPRAHSL